MHVPPSWFQRNYECVCLYPYDTFHLYQQLVSRWTVAATQLLTFSCLRAPEGPRFYNGTDIISRVVGRQYN